ncbi:MAG: PD-(D/E)XK nuclease family protein [Alloprevotella sp.]|nr:PD-(D/E)XK nuclease family protein [Alloprevotella sp.]
MEKDRFIEIAEQLVKTISKTKVQKPYNVFSEWKMNENDNTKLLLSLLRYNDAQGFTVLSSFLRRFARGRDKMVHYKHPSEVDIRFSPRYGAEKHSFIDGLVMMTAGKKRFALIIENKIYDAPDQSDQIRRYITHMTNDEGIGRENVWVFYLTGDGSKEVDKKSSYNPDEETETTNIGRRFVPLTYSEDILTWLKEDILNVRTYPETLTSVVRTYVDYLENDLFPTAAPSASLQTKLCNALGIATSTEKMAEQDFGTLYTFKDDVAKLRRTLREESAEQKEMDAIEVLYQVTRNIVQDIEHIAFCRFEEISEKILNEHWKKELKQKKKLWKARHRAMGTDRGFVQLALTDEWGTEHVEWIPICPMSMFYATEYTIELHVEGNTGLAMQWCEHLEKERLLLPDGKMKGTSRVFSYKLHTEKPFARMNDGELKSFLTKLYTQDFNYLFRMLVAKSKMLLVE